MTQELTHLDADGTVHMVDISQKTETTPTAIARGEVQMNQKHWR